MKKDVPTIGLISVAHAASHFFQLVTAPLLPLLSHDLDLPYSSLGLIVMFFYGASGLLQQAAGFLVDRVGPRTVLITGLAALALGAFVMSLAGGMVMLALGSVVMGAGNSVFHPADLSILSGRLEQRALAYGVSAHSMAGSLGFALAPVFGAAVGGAFGWRFALSGAAIIGIGVVLAMLAGRRHLHVTAAPVRREGLAADLRAIMVAPVILCFLYFLLWGATYIGIASFGIAAMQAGFGVGAALASFAISAYMIASAAGVLAGGYLAARIPRHDLVAGGGLFVASLFFLVVAMHAIPGGMLPVAFAGAGFAVGITYPSRDLIVRAAAPAGATGRVFGFVYAGLDAGSFSVPVFYGMLVDHGMPMGVFYVIFGLTWLALFTVVQLPRIRIAVQRS